MRIQYEIDYINHSRTDNYVRMNVIVYDLADGGSVRVSGPSLDEEPLSISYTHPDGTTEMLKQSTRVATTGPSSIGSIN